jgi:hypothetical protein
MKLITLCFMMLLVGCSATTVPLSKVDQAKSLEICLFTGVPPSDLSFTKLGKVKVGKGSFGSVVDILPKFAAQAQVLEADAIINYAGTQRFGFWPWRIIRPVARGQAIKWDSKVKPECSQVGGTTISSVISTRQAPQ